MTDPLKKDEKQNEKSPAEMIAESINSALKPVVDQLGALKQDIDALRAPKPPEKPATPNEIPSVLDDENAAFAQRLTPLYTRQLEFEATIERDRVRHEYEDAGFGDMWRQYQTDIDKQLIATALVQPDGNGGVKPLRGDPQYIRNVADMILGRAARSGGIKFDGANKKFFIEGANAEVPGGTPKPDLGGLTAKQARIFERMGVPLDKAKDTLSKLEFVS